MKVYRGNVTLMLDLAQEHLLKQAIVIIEMKRKRMDTGQNKDKVRKRLFSECEQLFCLESIRN